MRFLTLLFVLLLSGTIIASNLSIDDLNSQIKAKGYKWQAGHNKIFDMPYELKKAMLGGPVPKELPPTQVDLDYVSAMPDAFRWDDYLGCNWMTPVRDQGGCGSCWAFGAVGTFEGQLKITNGNPYNDDFDMSEQYLVSTCCSAGDCGGGDHGSALAFIASTGITDEACFPYKAKNASCNERCSDWALRMHKAASSFMIAAITVQPLKDQLRKGPIAVSFMVYEDFMAYKSGVYQYTYGSFLGGHVVTLVGWDDQYSCWACKNSWGKDWGEKGYFRIKWGNCGIGMLFNYACTVNKDSKGITVKVPNGGENWRAGDTYEVKWQPKGEIKTVDLYYTLDGGISWSIIASDVHNTGSYMWTIPSYAYYTTYAYVKVVEHNTGNTEDRSDDYFTIQQKNGFASDRAFSFIPSPSIRLLTPQPIRDMAVWSINTPKLSKIDVKVFDISGRLIDASRISLTSGCGTYTFNPENTGVYIIVFGKGLYKEKFVVLR